jgi:tRNA G46 methylase TrmB
VLDALRARGVDPARVLEPTCGSGAFIEAAATAFPAADIVGVEYQRERYGGALAALQRSLPRLTVRYANAYEIDLGARAARC